MKKAIFFLPILIGLLTCNACSCAQKSGGKKKTEESSTSEDVSIPDEPVTSESTYTSGPIRADVVKDGSNHSLPWNIDYDNFKDSSGSLSYHAYHKTYEFAGTNIYCYGMRAVTDISVNISGSLTTFKGFKVIHLCKSGHETWVDGGQLQISKLQPSKLILEIVLYNIYSLKVPTIYAGEKMVTQYTKNDGSPSPIREEFKVYTVTYDISVDSPQVFKIQNRNTSSMYIQSMRFE